MATGLPPISYPAFTWYKDYIFLAQTPLNLCAHPRSAFEESVQQARSGQQHLVDADGRYFDVADWTRVPPFGGFTGFALRLIGTIYAAPVLTNERHRTLEEFKKAIAREVRSRYRYDGNKYPAVDTINKLRDAVSYKAALDAVPWP